MYTANVYSELQWDTVFMGKFVTINAITFAGNRKIPIRITSIFWVPSDTQKILVVLEKKIFTV